MNIQRLLKKLDKNSVDSKRQLLTAQAAYKLKTSESIGTLNSIADQNQRSFVISDAITPQNRRFQQNNFSANSKLDEELVNIQKMKNLYQSRQNKNRVRNKSFDRSSASGKKSSQKHLLRPSNTPSFNKIQKPKVVHQNDSACKNLYTQQILQNSQSSQISQTNQINNTKLGDRKNYFQYPESSLHVEDHENEPYEQQPSYNEQSLSQIANISQDLPHDTSIQKIQKKVKQNLEQTWQNENSSVPNQETNRHKNSATNCLCSFQGSSFISKEEFNLMMASIENKMDAFAKRIDHLQAQNKEIRTHHQQILKQNQKYKEALDIANEEKQKAIEEMKKQINQKQQLQVLLKDVLYKRQREKLQSSKENTYRQNERSEKRLNNFSFVQSQSTNELKPARISSNSSTQNRQSESKMKVQNLLQKLHIKVDRA